MKNFFLKATLLLMCSAFVFSSCTSGENEGGKVTVTMDYRIIINAATVYNEHPDAPAIQELYKFASDEMSAATKLLGKERWEIKSSADTEKAAIEACDKKAIAIFDVILPALNTASATIKANFEAKKTSLSAKLALEPNKAHVKFTDLAGILYKGTKEDIILTTEVKEGTTYNMEAVGGAK